MNKLTKYCPACELELELDSFYKDGKSHKRLCKFCFSIKRMESYRTNKLVRDKKAQQNKEYYQRRHKKTDQDNES